MSNATNETEKIQIGGYVAYDRMYRLCNKKQYFTCGSCRQYDKFFEMVREKMSLESIARVLWVCSNDNFTYEEVYQDCYENLMVNKEDIDCE